MATTTKTKTAARYYEAVGKRKEAVARVRLLADTKHSFVVNGRPFEKYFSIEEMRLIPKRVLDLTPLPEKMSISVQLHGGGLHAQAEALAHGLARALVKFLPANRAILKPQKTLTRDARIKERRKFGLKKARKAPQWSKR